MSIGLATIHLQFPGCRSLKEKRGILLPILSRLHKEFNVSAAEIDALDNWSDAVVGVVVISNDPTHNMQVMQRIVDFIPSHFPDVEIIDQLLELR